MLSSDSPGTLSLSAKITKFSSDSPGSHCQSPNFSHNQKYKSHMQRNSVVFTYFSHAYHYCQELHRLYLPHLPYSNGSQVFQPCSVLWYLPKICSRISQICLCISVSKSLRWSRNIAMMSRWFALRRTSSSNGKSHPKRTSKVCISRKTLVTLSNPIIQPMYCSSIASRNGRLLVRLSILSTDRMAILFLSLNASVPTKNPVVFSTFTFKGLLGQLSASSLSKHLTCVFRTYSQLQPTNLTYFSLLISRQVVGVLILSKHLTCVFRTHSQPQPVEIFSMLISRQVVGVFTVQTPHLCLQDLLPTSACRDTHHHFKSMSSPAINWQVTSIKNDLTANMPQKWNKTHHLNQEYSSSSMPLTLHQQCTNPVITSEP